MQRLLEGKVVLVTGAGVRLGRAIALGLAHAGADVGVHFHGSREPALELVRALRVDGNRAEAFCADLTVPAQVEALAETVHQTLGPVEALVNSAGVLERADFVETTLEALEHQWALNARAPYLLSQAVVRRARREGRRLDIVNVVDIAGPLQAWAQHSAYCMSKAALASLTRTLAVELAPDVRVNGVLPGMVLPPEALLAAERESLAARIPQRRFGEPADVVEATLFLLTGPRFMTGQLLAVDGGRSVASGA